MKHMEKNLIKLTKFWNYCFPALRCFEVFCCLGHSFYYFTGEFRNTNDVLSQDLKRNEPMRRCASLAVLFGSI